MTQSPMQRKRSMTITVSNNSVSGIVLSTEPRLTPEFSFHYLGPFSSSSSIPHSNSSLLNIFVTV